jgi:hypothetical protein
MNQQGNSRRCQHPLVMTIFILLIALGLLALAAWFMFVAMVTAMLPRGAWEMMRRRPDLAEWYYGSRERRRVMRDLHRQYGADLTGKIHRPDA